MDDKSKGDKTLIIVIFSIGFFLFMTFLIKWNFFVVAILSVLIYLGLSLVTSPVRKLGGVDLEKIDQGHRLADIYELAEKNYGEMQAFQKMIKDTEISSKSKKLNIKAQNILSYLSKNTQAISPSEHFLDYYLDTANRIVKNYVEMEDTDVSEAKRTLIKDETGQSLDYLEEIFSRQLDSYYEDKILSLEVESDLLEKTVKLGGGR